MGYSFLLFKYDQFSDHPSICSRFSQVFSTFPVLGGSYVSSLEQSIPSERDHSEVKVWQLRAFPTNFIHGRIPETKSPFNSFSSSSFSEINDWHAISSYLGRLYQLVAGVFETMNPAAPGLKFLWCCNTCDKSMWIQAKIILWWKEPPLFENKEFFWAGQL